MTLLCLAALLLLLTPLLPWYADRMHGPWALVLLPVLATLGRPPRSLDLRATALTLMLYGVARPFLPELPRAVLAALALAALLSAWRGRVLEPGLAGLLLLSLPGLSPPGLEMLSIGLLLVFLLATLHRWTPAATLCWSLLAVPSLIAASRLAQVSIASLPVAPCTLAVAVIFLSLGTSLPPAGPVAASPWRGQRAYLAALLLTATLTFV